jgi:N-acetylmuramoyl-L-alanine amidase
MQLAWSVQRHLLAATRGEDRGVRRARFAVLRTLPCPGILIEGGFVSSRREGALIGTPSYRQQVAEAIAAGVAEYARSVQPVAR